MYSCHLLFIPSTSIRSTLCLSFFVLIFAWNVPLVSLIFLKRSLVFSFYYFPLFLCIDHWGRLSYLSLLFFGMLHSVGYDFLFSFAFHFFFSVIYKASSENHFDLLYLSFLGMVLFIIFCTMLRTSVHSSSGTLSISFKFLNLFVTFTV